MLANRSIPRCTVIPLLAYPDVGEAIDWLCDAFGFTFGLRIGNHGAQLNVGDGVVALTEQGSGAAQTSLSADRPPGGGGFAASVMVRVEDVEQHHERARQRGALILRPPTYYPYGERQYTTEDFPGRSRNRLRTSLPKNRVAAGPELELSNRESSTSSC